MMTKLYKDEFCISLTKFKPATFTSASIQIQNVLNKFGSTKNKDSVIRSLKNHAVTRERMIVTPMDE